MTGFDTGAEARQLYWMADSGPNFDESEWKTIGEIPGVPGQPVCSVLSRDPSSIPVMISVPHAGRAYPPELAESMRHPRAAALRLEDRYVDLVGKAVAERTGAALLTAHAPRALIDLNRSVDDVDWDMLVRGRHDGGDRQIGVRARSGLGLIPRRLHGLGEIWKRRIDERELSERISAVHEPYHHTLDQQLKRLQRRWGAALLVDLHSMPPLGPRGSHPPSEFVIGDRFGDSCHGALVAAAFASLAESGRPAGHNRPYAGGYVLERHSDPLNGLHALQIEVDRSAYLDAGLVEPGKGFDRTVEILSRMVGNLADEVANLGQNNPRGHWPVAAE